MRFFNPIPGICAFLAVSALAVLGAFSAQAQDGADKDALLVEFFALIAEKDTGFRASEAILSQSFAAHLHGPAAPQSVADLSRRTAAYDPIGKGSFTAGMLSFHLARPVAILRELGGGANEVLARIVEIRLRWLSGAPDLALEQASELIGQMDQEGMGWNDPEMVSLLADAAVLSWRTGQAEAARRYFDRAQGCGVHRCPDDLVFGWLGPDRKAQNTRFEGYDSKAMRARAKEDAEILFPGNAQVLEDIDREAVLISRQGRALIATALDRAKSTADSDTLTGSDRRNMGQLAMRLVGSLGMESYLMQADSVGGQARAKALIGQSFETPDLQDVSYLEQDSRFNQLLIRNLPLVQALLRHSNRRGDQIVAELIRIRLVLASGARARVLPDLQALIGQARALGFTDGELFSVWMDLWAVAILTDNPAVAAQAIDHTTNCRATACDQDLVLGYFTQAKAIPRMQAPQNMKDLYLGAADPFVRSEFPGDPLKLADLYQTGVGGAQHRPMDAARYDQLSMRYVESAVDIAPDDLVARAASVMETLVYASKYSAAAALGDRIMARLRTEGADQALTARFYQTRARAAFRLGDARARQFYASAVDLVIARHDGDRSWRVPEDLALDLLDTDYLPLLDRLLSGEDGNPGVKARLRYRQGRPEDAADILAARRRYLEVYGTNSLMADFFTEQAQTHLKNRHMDAFVASILLATDAETGKSVPADHHRVYAHYFDLKALAVQEAVYRQAAGDLAEARRLRALGGAPVWFSARWLPLTDAPEAEASAALDARYWKSDSSYDLIRDVIEMRDNGNYEAAAQYLKSFRWVAVAAEENGEYIDAQTLWQMAFTFARVGEADIAFDLMDRAARIAARLSFAGAGGAGGGTLQLLERDRGRYLLFVDIAWAALSGQAPQDMLVVSRY